MTISNIVSKLRHDLKMHGNLMRVTPSDSQGFKDFAERVGDMLWTVDASSGSAAPPSFSPPPQSPSAQRSQAGTPPADSRLLSWHQIDVSKEDIISIWKEAERMGEVPPLDEESSEEDKRTAVETKAAVETKPCGAKKRGADEEESMEVSQEVKKPKVAGADNDSDAEETTAPANSEGPKQLPALQTDGEPTQVQSRQLPAPQVQSRQLPQPQITACAEHVPQGRLKAWREELGRGMEGVAEKISGTISTTTALVLLLITGLIVFGGPIALYVSGMAWGPFLAFSSWPVAGFVWLLLERCEQSQPESAITRQQAKIGNGAGCDTGTKFLDTIDV